MEITGFVGYFSFASRILEAGIITSLVGLVSAFRYTLRATIWKRTIKRILRDINIIL